ncbi:MAG: peptidyl-prolyl cis-trans isomerase [Desulfuromonadales bacterium]|nr:peptidyl-prolyl cis-trans isomerase [Desulfuromonadales bacterium]MDH3867837.1 peptidyl-prolyl cis-trans isomerase [Desulfuromonadales bacterium]MDH4024948.1 peptidyl-prolyl cis-trans isomerase [Desulfuromonadales bacterium]
MHRTHLRIFSLLLCLCGLVAGCSSEPVVEALPALIVINDQEITKADFLVEFEQSLQKDQQLSGIEREELQRSFLVQLIDRELIHGEARRLNIALTDADVEVALQGYREDYPGSSFEEMLVERGLTLEAWREELKESLIMEKLLEQAVYSMVSVSDEEVAAYFKANRDQFDRPEQVRARQIVVADEAEGQEVLGILRQERPFAEVAAEYSLSPDAEQGGDLGFFSRGEMPPEFDEIVFDLPVKRLSDLVQSEYGYHIFLVEEKRKAKRLNKKEASDEIRAILDGRKKEEVYLAWLQDMRARAVISVDWAQLEKNERK